MNKNLLINGAIGAYGIYNVYQQVMSEYTTVNVFGITMNKWIYVAIWCAIIYSSLSSLYKYMQAQQRSR